MRPDSARRTNETEMVKKYLDWLMEVWSVAMAVAVLWHWRFGRGWAALHCVRSACGAATGKPRPRSRQVHRNRELRRNQSRL